MTLSTALNSATSGLTAVGQATLLVSDNIANALTPGYGHRSLEVSANANVGGVTMDGIVRRSDPVLISNRRAADARFAFAEANANFHRQMEMLVGAPDDPGGYLQSLAGFENSLLMAASLPSSNERLNDVAFQAVALTNALNSASEGLREMRNQADRTIDVMVNDLNAALIQVEELNAQITSATTSGGNVAGLMDQRQTAIDQINQLVPVTVVERPHGQVALYSEGGAILLDGSAAEIGFTPVNQTVPQMTLENGALSGLTVNGVEISTDAATGPLRGGALSAQFEQRDVWAVEAQAALDAVARDLIERFEDPALDPTLGVGDPGLFTDDGSALDPTLEIGLAGRISVNALVDPAQGGETWRLRDGLGAAAPGEPGDATLLQAYTSALTEPRVLASGPFGTGGMTAADVSGGLTSHFSAKANNSQDALTFASASLTELLRLELEQGVDTDAELQTLLVLEQAYAANAKVIETVDLMFDALMRI